jgi:hypothetical protein
MISLECRITLSIISLIVVAVFSSHQNSFAQFIPVPPPGPSSSSNTQQETSPASSVPTVEFLTQSLKQGKNVFSVKVVGSAPIDYVQMKVASNGKIVATKMEPENGNIYKLLLDAQGPSKVVVIRAFDVNGRYSEAVKTYDVQASADVLGSIKDFFGGIMPH